MYFFKITTPLTKDEMNDRFYKLSVVQMEHAIRVNKLIMASVELYFLTGSVAFHVLDENTANKVFLLYDRFISPNYKYDLSIEVSTCYHIVHIETFVSCIIHTIKHFVAANFNAGCILCRNDVV
jgi:hypothetical protein